MKKQTLTAETPQAINEARFYFVNLYFGQSGALQGGSERFVSQDAALAGKCKDGTYACTVKVTHVVELV